MAESDLPFASEGDFDPRGYAAILSAAYRRQLPGLLVLTGAGSVKKIYLGNGHISYASSNLPAERLGDILLRKNIITREQFDRSSLLIRETGKRQGTILVQMGATDPKGLFQGLILQVTEIAESPFLWERGHYTYLPSFNQEEEMIILKVNPGAVIRKGLWKAPLTDACLPLAGKRFAAAPDCPFTAEDVSLSPLDRKILAAAPQGKTPADLSAEAGIPLNIVTRSFDILTLLGFIRPAGEAGAEADQVKKAEPPAHQDDRNRNEVLDLHGKLPRLNHYQVLGVEPNCDSREIKQAYIVKAKEFHPDRFSRPGMEDLVPLAHAIFTAVNNAYNTLSEGERRHEYDRSLKFIPPTEAQAKTASDAALAAEQFKKGLRLLKCGEAWDAAEAFKWAVRLNPEKAPHHAYLGLALQETGRRLKEAEGHLKTALSLDPANPEYHVILGRIYNRGKVPDKAAEAFRKALKIDPGREDAQRELEQMPKKNRQPDEKEASILEKLFGK